MVERAVVLAGAAPSGSEHFPLGHRTDCEKVPENYEDPVRGSPRPGRRALESRISDRLWSGPMEQAQGRALLAISERTLWYK